MNIVVERRDLFTVNDAEYALAHCVSADYTMRAGIAVEFVHRYDARNQCLRTKPRPTVPDSVYFKYDGRVNIFNLVTKSKHWHKPDYTDLSQALEYMKQQVIDLGITKIAMPKIGCGLDQLRWPTVRKYIEEVFSDIEDLEILVCYKKAVPKW